MKITKLALIALLGGALMAIGCGDDETNGTGGVGGGGGMGGMDTIDPLCEPQEMTCTDGTINEHTPCCEQAVPELADACTGDESTVSPETCDATGTVVVHTLRLMETADSCNTGFDLDSCDGITCVPGGLAPFEGVNGVDNGLTGLAPTLDGVGGNLDGVNQAFADALCGETDDATSGTCSGGAEDGQPCAAQCVGGANDGELCLEDADCPEGTCDADAQCTGEEAECDYDDNDCDVAIPPLVITFGVDANPAQSCANVEIKSQGACGTEPGMGSGAACTSDADCETEGETCLGGGTSTAIINISDATTAGTVCASGTLGAIPISIGGVPGTFGNVVVRATVDQAQGFTGLLGSTVDEATAVQIAELLLEGAGAVVSQVLDISDSLTQDTGAACNALSTSLVVGGIVPAAN